MFEINVFNHIEFKYTNENFSITALVKNTDGGIVERKPIKRTKDLLEAVSAINHFKDKNNHETYNYLDNLSIHHFRCKTYYAYNYLEFNSGKLIVKRNNIDQGEFIQILNAIAGKEGYESKFT